MDGGGGGELDSLPQKKIYHFFWEDKYPFSGRKVHFKQMRTTNRTKIIFFFFFENHKKIKYKICRFRNFARNFEKTCRFRNFPRNFEKKIAPHHYMN